MTNHDRPRASFDLGKRLDSRGAFRMPDEHLATHMAVLGTTGSGKSRLLWQLLREHRRNRRGFCLIDPGDLADDFLADCAREVIETGSKNILKKIHVLELSPFCCARYDPFRFHYPKAVHPELLEAARRSWQHTKVQSVAEIFQRKQGQSDFEGMPRLQRNLTNVLTCVATLVEGRRLSVADALVILDLGHPLHDRAFGRLLSAGALPREVAADFETIHAFTRVQDLRTETESTLNRLRSLLGPLMAQTLSGTGREPALDLYRIVQRGDYLIVKVARTPFASQDQNRGLAGLVIHDLVETMLVTPRELRKPFTLIIDEAGQQATSPDVADAMEVSRKYGLGWVLAGINLQSFRRKDFDMAPALLSLCNTVVCFRQKWPEDTEVLARVLFGGNLDFTPLVNEVERRGPYEWHAVTETSDGTNEVVNWSNSNAEGSSESSSKTHTKSKSRQDSWSDGTTEQVGGGSTRTSGESAGQTASGSNSQSPLIVDGEVKKMLALTGSQHGESRTTQSSTSQARSHSEAESHSRGGSTGRTEGDANGTTKGTSKTRSRSDGGAEGRSHTVSHKLVPLATVVLETVKTGSLERSVSDQFEQFRQTIQTLRQRQAAVLSPDGPAAFRIETGEVRDPFVSADAQAKAVEWVKRELMATHPLPVRSRHGPHAGGEPRAGVRRGVGRGRGARDPRRGRSYRRRGRVRQLKIFLLTNAERSS
jgi:hypothetical protein